MADDNRLVAAAALYMRSVRDSETGWTTARTEADFIAGWRAAIEEAQREDWAASEARADEDIREGRVVKVADAADMIARLHAHADAAAAARVEEAQHEGGELLTGESPRYVTRFEATVESAAPPLPVVALDLNDALRALETAATNYSMMMTYDRFEECIAAVVAAHRDSEGTQ